MKFSGFATTSAPKTDESPVLMDKPASISQENAGNPDVKAREKRFFTKILFKNCDCIIFFLSLKIRLSAFSETHSRFPVYREPFSKLFLGNGSDARRNDAKGEKRSGKTHSADRNRPRVREKRKPRKRFDGSEALTESKP